MIKKLQIRVLRFHKLPEQTEKIHNIFVKDYPDFIERTIKITN